MLYQQVVISLAFVPRAWTIRTTKRDTARNGLSLVMSFDPQGSKNDSSRALLLYDSKESKQGGKRDSADPSLAILGSPSHDAGIGIQERKSFRALQHPCTDATVYPRQQIKSCPTHLLVCEPDMLLLMVGWMDACGLLGDARVQIGVKATHFITLTLNGERGIAWISREDERINTCFFSSTSIPFVPVNVDNS